MFWSELRASFSLKSIGSNGLFGQIASSIRSNQIKNLKNDEKSKKNRFRSADLSELFEPNRIKSSGVLLLYQINSVLHFQEREILI